MLFLNICFALSELVAMQSDRTVRISSSEEELVRFVSDLIIEEARKAKEDHGFFSIGFSGGSIVKIVSLGLLARQAEVDWHSWRVFLCDERHVDLNNPDSNYKAVYDGFLSKVSVPEEHIFTSDASLTVEEAAEAYSQKLRSVHGKEGFPAVDLLLLGMGPDGHTCSLFPGHPLLGEATKLVASISDSPKPPPQRITLTLPVVNAARCVAFIAAGEGKAPMVRRVLEPAEGEDIVPAGLVKPSNGRLIWFLDSGSASQLQRPRL